MVRKGGIGCHSNPSFDVTDPAIFATILENQTNQLLLLPRYYTIIRFRCRDLGMWGTEGLGGPRV
jgi:hypothetical protein